MMMQGIDLTIFPTGKERRRGWDRRSAILRSSAHALASVFLETKNLLMKNHIHKTLTSYSFEFFDNNHSF